MVDYSKWDNFVDSDEEDDNQSGLSVHTIDQGSSIHIGPSGASVVPSVSKNSQKSSSTSQALQEPQEKKCTGDEMFDAPTHRWNQDRYEGNDKDLP